MARQYVAIEFHRGGRTYTYHHDGEAIVPGDEVKVPDRSGDGWSRVRVVEVDWIKPGFETKPILGRIEPEKPKAEEPVDFFDWLNDADEDVQSFIDRDRE